MATRSLHFCNQAGCKRLVSGTYCEEHAPLHATYTDNRASAAERGYDTRWSKFSKRYLAHPEHQFCALHISPTCRGIAECVDHIHPLAGPHDPGKFDRNNLQPSCLPCNTLKGKQIIRGTWVYGQNDSNTTK
jgi:5-methylcytosine-specific restriction protein A